MIRDQREGGGEQSQPGGGEELARSEPKGEKFKSGVYFPYFSERVAAAMEKANIGVPRLQELTGLSRPTLRRVLNGDGNPVLSNLYEVSKAVKEPLGWLLGPARGRPADAGPKPRHFLLGEPPPGDPTALWIYEEAVRGRDQADLEFEVAQGSFRHPGETSAHAINRAILDTFHFRQVWIHGCHVPRVERLERDIAKKFSLPSIAELSDSMPVRVIDIDESMHPLLRIFAVAAVSASVSGELMRTFKTLGVGDGFSTAAWQMFMHRGALGRVELLPLVLTPDYTQFELSGNSIVASLMRTHHDYNVGTSIELDDLKSKISQVDHAVLSCGPGTDEQNARLPRLIRASSLDYAEFFANIEKRAVGDLLYSFLTKKGTVLKLPEITGDLSTLDRKELRGRKEKPLVYTTPLRELAAIAKRGVSLVQSHQSDRAPVLRAALSQKNRPVNFLVITRDLAEAMLED